MWIYIYMCVYTYIYTHTHIAAGSFLEFGVKFSKPSDSVSIKPPNVCARTLPSFPAARCPCFLRGPSPLQTPDTSVRIVLVHSWKNVSWSINLIPTLTTWHSSKCKLCEYVPVAFTTSQFFCTFLLLQLQRCLQLLYSSLFLTEHPGVLIVPMKLKLFSEIDQLPVTYL